MKLERLSLSGLEKGGDGNDFFLSLVFLSRILLITFAAQFVFQRPTSFGRITLTTSRYPIQLNTLRHGSFGALFCCWSLNLRKIRFPLDKYLFIHFILRSH